MVCLLVCCCAAAMTSRGGANVDHPYRGRVLVVVTCHADDFSIFAGGSIAKLIAEGYTGFLVRITDDEKSGGPDPQHNAAQNDREVREAARILGFREVYSLGFKNDELERTPHVRLRDGIMYYLRKLHADTIYTFDSYATYGEENPDHLAVARAAEDAAQNAGNPLYAPDQVRSGITPQIVRDGYYWGRAPMDVNTVTDTSAYIDRKMSALSRHHAQFGPDLVDYFRKNDEAVGRIYGLKAAEVSHYIEYAAGGENEVRVRPMKTHSQAAVETALHGSAETWRGKVIVIISPHGVDYVRAMGGTIAKAAQQGANIYLVRVTNDEAHGGDLPSTEARTRLAAETRRAAAILGIRQVIDLDLKDGEVAEVAEPELRARFASIFRSLAPDAVFTVDPWARYDPDSDDARIGHAVEDAAWSASHVSFYPEILLEPKTRFKVIVDRYFWTSNGGRQEPNHHEDIDEQLEAKSRAVSAMPSALNNHANRPVAPVESYYRYHAANPLDWFRAWLEEDKAAPVAPKPLTIRPPTHGSRRTLVITPEPADWLVYAGSAIRGLATAGHGITLISVGNGECSGFAFTELSRVGRSQGIADVISLGYRESQLSAVPPLIIRDRLLQRLHLEDPDTVVLPDAWQSYSSHESSVVGRIGADAILRWALTRTRPVRVLYWRTSGGGSFVFDGDAVQKRAVLSQSRLGRADMPKREFFEVAEIGR